MEKETLESLVAQGLSTHEIANAMHMGQTTIRYWLKKHNLKTDRNRCNSGGNYATLFRQGITHLCKFCGEKDKSKFRSRKEGSRLIETICKSCHCLQTIERFRNNKQKAVDYKGGECSLCGYKKCVDSMHFHHKDPSQKDPFFKNFKKRNFEKIKEELDKCILVCANCHGEIHNEIRMATLTERSLKQNKLTMPV